MSRRELTNVIPGPDWFALKMEDLQSAFDLVRAVNEHCEVVVSCDDESLYKFTDFAVFRTLENSGKGQIGQIEFRSGWNDTDEILLKFSKWTGQKATISGSTSFVALNAERCRAIFRAIQPWYSPILKPKNGHLLLLPGFLTGVSLFYLFSDGLSSPNVISAAKTRFFQIIFGANSVLSFFTTTREYFFPRRSFLIGDALRVRQFRDALRSIVWVVIIIGLLVGLGATAISAWTK